MKVLSGAEFTRQQMDTMIRAAADDCGCGGGAVYAAALDAAVKFATDNPLIGDELIAVIRKELT